MTALAILLLTYLIVGIQKIPRVHISRAAGALVGAVAMVLFGVLTPAQAYAAIDLDTIVFLLGMMIIVAYLEISGFFEVLELFILKRAHSRGALLALIVASSGLLSAFFMNDTICLMFTPVLLRLVQRLELPPQPYLIALATAANIGSTMTVIGNPQNMLIGLRSGIHFLDFWLALLPIALAGLVLDFGLIWMVYRRQLSLPLKPLPDLPKPANAQVQRGLLILSSLVMLLFLMLLMLGYAPQAVAISCAALLIVLGSNRPRRPLQYVDWPLLLIFAGLFVVMRGVEEAGLIDQVISHASRWFSGRFAVLNISWVTLVASNLVSNVPAVLLLSPVISLAGGGTLAWLSLAMASTLAGNLTLIGSTANLIVLESADRQGFQLGFFEYLKVGLPLTLLTIGLGVLVLSFKL
ncbi:MAG: anion transporter [Candidatus Acetothermia bacterium]|nr:anion transporter [Candidatus Acetothermia bacterium]